MAPSSRRADAVVIAMGPWSLMAAAWVHLPAVFGRRSPSLVYDTGRDVPADALFLEYHEESGAVLTVEVFPRADGSTHIVALSSVDCASPDPLLSHPQQRFLFERANRLGCLLTALLGSFAEPACIVFWQGVLWFHRALARTAKKVAVSKLETLGNVIRPYFPRQAVRRRKLGRGAP
jgi:hypothetical protein